MRMLVHTSIPVDKGSEAFDSGEMQRVVNDFVERVHPEASYFFVDRNGNRSASFVFDMEGPWQLPPLLEPALHSLGASVHVTPVMNLEDLQRGVQETRAQ